MTNSALLCPKPNPGAVVRLFCFPHAGGSAGIFRSWAAELPDTIEVRAIELPGRGMRMHEEPLTECSEIVKSLLPVLLAHRDKPMALFGHSLGALIAFEVARFLQIQGFVIDTLFASGASAPHMPRREDPIHNLPDLEFTAKLRKLNGTPAELLENPDFLKLVIPMLRADFHVVDSYAFVDGVKLHCPVYAFGGSDDPEADENQIAGWREITSGRFAMQIFSGDHFFMYSARDLLLKHIAAELGSLYNPLDRSGRAGKPWNEAAQ